jgi:hypothetical protein
MGDQFEKGLYDAIGDELVKSANILRRELSLVLTTTGKGSKKPPRHSPTTSKIPWNVTGNLAGSWHSSPRAIRSGGKFTAGVYTIVGYAWDLHVKAPIHGGRNFMDENLYWYQKTVAKIKKQLDPQRLIRVATGNFRF